ncbi:MAG: ATP-binding cassette domain-containing protein [Polyangiaceae bacterium]|nr:ATP-binding cassette domain-containing protein [Polyangiaceae bacterium]
MIEAKGLTKYFGSFRALDRVSFEVRRGEIVGFLGPNGAGKSTTMRILTCFLSASAGTARVHGIDAFDNPLEVRRKIGYLPQRAPLYGEMSVWEYLRFCSEMRGLDISTFKSRMRKIVEVCGLARVLGKDIRTLSHGYRQRVGLGQALVHDPPVLILDEPTSDLDPNERAEVVRYIQETGRNRTILLSTHNLNEVEAVCARSIIVSKGRIVADGPLDQIRSVSGKVRYLVSVDGERLASGRGGKPPSAQEIQNELRAVPGVTSVRELIAEGWKGPKQGGSIYRFELRGSDKSDLRADLYQLGLQRGWIILELRRESESLEEAFRALTRDDERGDRGRVGRDVEEAFVPGGADEEDEEEEDEEDVEDERDEEGSDEETSEDEDAEDESEEDEAADAKASQEENDEADEGEEDEAEEEEPSAKESSTAKGKKKDER